VEYIHPLLSGIINWYGIGAFALISGMVYCHGNVVVGFLAAKNKLEALIIMQHYFHLHFALVIAYKFSPLFLEAPALFLLGIGMWMTYCCSYLNISSTSKCRFDPVFYDPFIFFAFVALENQQVLPKEVMIGLYSVQAVLIVIKYMRFIAYIINQLTEYLDIKLLWVKPVKIRTD
jgi:hypothetical protein